MLIRSLPNRCLAAAPTAITLGNFDGVHLGHQALIQQLVSVSDDKGLVSTVVTFEPTPKEFFMGGNAPARLSLLREKYVLLRDLGVQQVISIAFDHAFSSIDAKQFIRQYLVDMLRVKHIVIGDDFRFGKNRTGNYNLLCNQSTQHNYAVEGSPTITAGGQRISSSLVRKALAEGDFGLAKKILGRAFTVSGKVFHGDRRGRQLGFPTANIVLRHPVLPISGVFAVTAAVQHGHTWQGVANVGHRPTVGGTRNQLEVHLFECSENLYGQRLSVSFEAKLREEKKFSSLEELKNQIHIDLQQAKERLTTNGP